jgi:predicted metalloprotease
VDPDPLDQPLSRLLCRSVVASPAGRIDCEVRTMTAFWTKELGRPVSAKVAYEPPTSSIPAACRPGLETAIAFYCELDDTIVLGPAFVAETGRAGHYLDYAQVSVIAHEVGHRVQRIVGQPGFTSESASSPAIEQQADCLSGVWAGAEYRAGRLDPGIFLQITKQQLSDVSDNPEIETHGTPPVRFAAVTRGLDGGTAACRLGKPL